jgi:hypothetical protein
MSADLEETHYLELKDSVKELQQEVEELKAALARFENVNKPVLELRVVPIDEAKELTLSYLKEHEHSWTSEIAEALGIDYLIVHEALHELKAEGVLDSRSD